MVNQATHDCVYKPVLHSTDSDAGRFVTCLSSEFVVNAGGTSAYPLEFSPRWMCSGSVILELRNVTTGETVEYHIEMVAKEPLSEGHIRIPCTARELTEHSIQVPNFTHHSHGVRSSRIKVETDLLDVFGTESVVVVLSTLTEFTYVLQVKAAAARTVTGSVTFTDIASGEYCWFTVEIVAAPPAIDPSSIIKLECLVRESVRAEIELSNPSDTTAVFTVDIHGSGLTGESRFELEPKSANEYLLIYSPTNASGSELGSITFSSDRLGEVYYSLELTATGPPPTDLGIIETVLGETESISIPIENTSSSPLNLTVAVMTNTNEFAIPESRVTVAPKSIGQIRVAYTPSCIGVPVSTSVRVADPRAGGWEYTVAGVGLLPCDPKEVQITAELFKSRTFDDIIFLNPFTSKTEFVIKLGSNSDDCIQVVLKRTVVTLKPREVVRIPIMFTARTLETSIATITVTGNGLIWRYRIVGFPEIPVDTSEARSFTTACRTRLRTIYAFSLKGCHAHTPDELEVSFQPTAPFERLMASTFKPSLLSTGWTRTGTDLNVLVSIDFHPFRPFSADTILVITSEASSTAIRADRWRFQVRLEATPPPVDDTIVIETPLNVTGSVAFNLSNVGHEFAQFEASFVDASGKHANCPFTVSPIKGVLSPAGTDPTQFVISFRPTEYGRGTASAKLVIQSELVMWSFQVKGSFPRYTPQTAIKHKVESHR